MPLTVTLDASSPGVLLPFDVPDVRRIVLLRRGPTGLALPSIGEDAPVPLDMPNEYGNIGPWLNEPPPLRELPRFLPLESMWSLFIIVVGGITRMPRSLPCGNGDIPIGWAGCGIGCCPCAGVCIGPIGGKYAGTL